MIKNQVIVITGGSGLLGSVFAKNIAIHGGLSIIADINYKAAEKVTNDIQVEYPGKAEAIELDITDKNSVLNSINEAKKKFGRIDAVINNAYPHNSNYGCKLEEVTYSDFCENTNLHLGGYFLVAQQFGIFFKSQGWGNIINISSIYGVIAPRFEIYKKTSMTMPIEYACIKSSIIHLTHYLAQYYKGNNIRVNSISPGGIFNNQPGTFIEAYNGYCNKKGMLLPDDIVGTLLFLLSNSSEYITGQNIIVDDGFSL
jgi:NAD(P)-dependent dehydrogenase (short-subunit alcohol dehydrogenase family)